jgi:hypothetical protein
MEKLRGMKEMAFRTYKKQYFEVSHSGMER